MICRTNSSSGGKLEIKNGIEKELFAIEDIEKNNFIEFDFNSEMLTPKASASTSYGYNNYSGTGAYLFIHILEFVYNICCDVMSFH